MQQGNDFCDEHANCSCLVLVLVARAASLVDGSRHDELKESPPAALLLLLYEKLLF